MPRIQKLVLDVLKPRLPSAPDFAIALARLGPDYRVHLDVEEIDEKTITTSITIEANDLDLERIKKVIEKMGGSVHSIDQVVASGDAEPES